MAASVHRPNRPGVAPDKAPDLAPGGRKRDTPLFLILAFLSLNAVLLVVVDRTVREPYMDEEFHIPQAQRYCEAFPPDFYHPDISTPPGLYWASALLARSLSTVLSFPASLLSKHFPPSSHARAKTRARREENEEPRSEDGARDEARDLPFLCRRFSLRAFGALFVSPLTLLLLWNLALRMHFSQEQPRKERRETPAACEPSRETQRLETSPRASNGQEDEGERGTAGSFSHGVESPAGFFASGSHASRSESAERRTPRPSRRALLLHLRVARIALLPTFYFFNFLFYTDCLSVMLLLFAYHQLLTCAHLWGLAAAGSLAFFVRQTAIVWSGGACLFAFLAALACRPASAREPQEKQTRMQGTQRHFSGKGRTPRGVSAARDKDEKTKAVEEKAQRGLCRGPALQRQALFGPVSVLTWENVKAVIVFFLSPRTLVDVSLPLALPLIAFFFFVVSNGGRVAVGHHAYHSPSVHTASLLYAALFVATAASPASLLSALRVVVSLAKSVFFAKSPFSLIPLGLSVFPSEKPSSKGPAKAGNAGNGETRVKAGKLKDGGEARELDAVCPRHAPLRKNGLRASRAAPADCDGQEDGGERDKQERPAGSGDELAGCTDTVEASGGGCVKQRLGRTGEMRMKTDSTVLERRAGSADTAEGLGDNRHSKPRGNLQRVNPFCEPFRCLFSLDCWVNLWSGKNIGEREDLANEAAALVLNGGVSAVIFYVFLCRPFIDYAGNVARFML
ncbi:conserved hypothetical protein [Neospora caninum Liverpool]|uniref:Dol-P-Glc:Glc(2)Man(9)GlcNAc(2)-PP-Dol alpha-1,2-glucosyltransferase n=1 Tax=Neospora caninum (strain Liverpool) TaxID=572307 RepID=F0VFZ4_NEOCL|nr:conserved hypothetical protein [Neospora caninum Liverpool]CBZ52638.1 conserved hypothetical protein [Neospora caninum Liverpool]|eukprot:XP_003882670.1 conserved hypothetical protein [Neospora caninum Liverpool]